MSKFFHYPEIQLNTNLILVNLTQNLKFHENKEVLILTIVDKVDIASFRETFTIFRGKLNGTCKMINMSHLNLIKNIVAVSPNEPVTKVLMYCFRAFFKANGNHNSKRFKEFQKKKLIDLDLEELVSFIGLQLTKSSKMVKFLMESDFFDDLIEYLIILATGFHSSENSNNTDFVSKIVEKKKMKKADDQLKKQIEKILKNLLGTVLSIYKTEDETLISQFDKKLIERDILSWEDIIEEVTSSLKNYSIQMENLKFELEILRMKEIRRISA